MIKLPSLVNEYTLIFSGDPSLNLPEVPTLADDATGEAKAEAKKVADERARLLSVARDTGNWDSLIKPGEKPTLFQMRHLSKMARDYIEGEMTRRNPGNSEFGTLVFRLAIKRIDNLGDIKIEHEDMGGFTIATTKSVNAIAQLGGVGDKIIAEIAGIAATKTYQPLDPL